MELLRSFFDELRVVERTPIIEQKSIYGLSALRDITTGTVTSDGKEFKVSTAGGATSSSLSTAERGPYPPGQEVEAGAAFRMPVKPTGGQVARVGYYDDQDGWYYEYDAQGLHLVQRKGGVDDKQLCAAWDDSGPASGSLQGGKFIPARGYVHQIAFTWYGYGPADFSYQMQSPIDGSWMQSFGVRRIVDQVSIDQPHLQVRCEVITTGGDGPFEAYISGRQVSIVGRYNTIFRETPIEKEGISITDGSWTPVLAIRRAAIRPYALAKIDNIDLLSSVSTRIAIGLDAEITNTLNWDDIEDVPTGETLMEANLDPGASALSSASYIQKSRASGGGGITRPSGSPLSLVRTPFIEQQPYLIWLRSVSGNGTASITVNVREDF